MDLTDVITAVLGGGLFLGVAALIKAITEGREKKSLTQNLELKTGAEIESVAVGTMAKALDSAQSRIASIEKERETDKLYYQGRIQELTDQLQRVRNEMAAMEIKLAELLAETHTAIAPKGDG